MPYYGPWLTAPDRVVRFGYLGDFADSDFSHYRTVSSTSSELSAQQETGFGTIVTDTDDAEPLAGHSYDGTTWQFQRARIAVTFHPGMDDSYVPAAPPAGGFWDFETPGVGAVIGDLTVVITPLAYTGGAGGTQFNYGLFEIGGLSPVINGTFSYGDTTPVTVTQTASDIGGGIYPASLDVWDTLQADGAPTFGVEAGTVQVASAVIATIRPTRYRAAYTERPPLAHRQRRDGTATAGPQLAHVGTAGGRPPLAWRQNTP